MPEAWFCAVLSHGARHMGDECCAILTPEQLLQPSNDSLALLPEYRVRRPEYSTTSNTRTGCASACPAVLVLRSCVDARCSPTCRLFAATGEDSRHVGKSSSAFHIIVWTDEGKANGGDRARERQGNLRTPTVLYIACADLFLGMVEHRS